MDQTGGTGAFLTKFHRGRKSKKKNCEKGGSLGNKGPSRGLNKLCFTARIRPPERTAGGERKKTGNAADGELESFDKEGTGKTATIVKPGN